LRPRAGEVDLGKRPAPLAERRREPHRKGGAEINRERLARREPWPKTPPVSPAKEEA
jgi:hypothetical protein